MITILMNWLKLGGHIVIEVRICKKWIHGTRKRRRKKRKMKLATISFCLFACWGARESVCVTRCFGGDAVFHFGNGQIYDFYRAHCILIYFQLLSAFNKHTNFASNFSLAKFSVRFLMNEKRLPCTVTGSFFFSLACLSPFLCDRLPVCVSLGDASVRGDLHSVPFCVIVIVSWFAVHSMVNSVNLFAFCMYASRNKDESWHTHTHT